MLHLGDGLYECCEGYFFPVFGGWVKVGDRGLHGGGTGRFGG